MSMDIYIFSDHQVGMTEWQAAIVEDGFDILLYQDAVFEELTGFLPVRLDGAGTGFYVYHSSSEETAELIHDFNDGGDNHSHPWKYSFSLSFGGDYRELIAAMSAGGSYARVTGGVVFEPEAGVYMQPAEVLEEAKKLATNLKDELGPPRYVWKDAGQDLQPAP